MSVELIPWTVGWFAAGAVFGLLWAMHGGDDHL